MRRSRLNKNTEKKTRKTIALSIIGIVMILFILFKFGLDFLVNFSLFLTGQKTQSTNSVSGDKIIFLDTPVLNQLPTATNSAQIVIAGKSKKDAKVYLYINNKEVDDVKANSDGAFVFNENLSSGNNQIKVNAQINDKKSSFSNNVDVIFKNSPPSLDVNSPSDGQSFKKDQNTANVTGKVDFGVSVTVNGFSAIIDYSNNFSYNLSLQGGDNQIKIIATDQAGNKTEKDLKVNYSQ